MLRERNHEPEAKMNTNHDDYTGMSWTLIAVVVAISTVVYHLMF
jgi:hypothetical protein